MRRIASTSHKNPNGMSKLLLHRLFLSPEGKVEKTDTMEFEVTRIFSDTIRGEDEDGAQIQVPRDHRLHKIPSGPYVRTAVMVNTSDLGISKGYVGIENLERTDTE